MESEKGSVGCKMDRKLIDYASFKALTVSLDDTVVSTDFDFVLFCCLITVLTTSKGFAGGRVSVAVDIALSTFVVVPMPPLVDAASSTLTRISF